MMNQKMSFTELWRKNCEVSLNSGHLNFNINFCQYLVVCIMLQANHRIQAFHEMPNIFCEIPNLNQANHKIKSFLPIIRGTYLRRKQGKKYDFH